MHMSLKEKFEWLIGSIAHLHVHFSVLSALFLSRQKELASLLPGSYLLTSILIDVQVKTPKGR